MVFQDPHFPLNPRPPYSRALLSAIPRLEASEAEETDEWDDALSEKGEPVIAPEQKSPMGVSLA